MLRWLSDAKPFQWAIMIGVAGICFAGSACRKETPEPTQTKEERRLNEKEMMQREMRNK